MKVSLPVVIDEMLRESRLDGNGQVRYEIVVKIPCLLDY